MASQRVSEKQRPSQHRKFQVRSRVTNAMSAITAYAIARPRKICSCHSGDESILRHQSINPRTPCCIHTPPTKPPTSIILDGPAAILHQIARNLCQTNPWLRGKRYQRWVWEKSEARMGIDMEITMGKRGWAREKERGREREWCRHLLNQTAHALAFCYLPGGLATDLGHQDSWEPCSRVTFSCIVPCNLFCFSARLLLSGPARPRPCYRDYITCI